MFRNCMYTSFAIVLLLSVLSVLIIALATNKAERSQERLLAKSCCVAAAACTGSKNCTACKNCKHCKYCSKDGETSGVCK